jgi:glycosyltransferase involved in cell wall biosynthesis
MRILYHHRTQAEDAQGIHISEMINAFRMSGHPVDLVALVELDEKREKKTKGKRWEQVALSVPNLVYELMELAYNLYGYRNLCRQIRKKKPDLIYERYSLNTFCGIWASRRFGIPIVLEVNAPLYYEQRKLGKLTFESVARFSERWICSNSTRTIVVSEVMKKMLEEEGVPPAQMTVMQNGINPKEFHLGISGEAIRKQYGIEGKVVVGFVGWFRPWHGLEMLVKMMHEAGLSEKNVCLLLVGDGPAYRDLYRYAEEHGLESSVIFTGPVKRPEMAAHIAAMDIAVQPSATEYACPMKIMEYMAMGKCIVAPDQPNIQEILQDRVNGYLFKPGDPERFKTALLEALQDEGARKKIGRSAYETIYQRKYLWSANAEETLNLVFGSGAQSIVKD